MSAIHRQLASMVEALAAALNAGEEAVSICISSITATGTQAADEAQSILQGMRDAKAELMKAAGMLECDTPDTESADAALETAMAMLERTIKREERSVCDGTY